MRSLNKAQIIGNLGRDPEMRSMANGDPVANFVVATNDSWKDKDGNLHERVEWHKVVAFRQLARVVTDHLSKGRTVYVEGQIQTREWEDRDGNKRYTTEIKAQNIIFLDRRGDGTARPADQDDEDVPF